MNAFMMQCIKERIHDALISLKRKDYALAKERIDQALELFRAHPEITNQDIGRSEQTLAEIRDRIYRKYERFCQ